MSTTAGQGGEADHEEVQTREGDHVDSQLTQIRVQLTGETQACSDARHDGRDEIVQVTVRRVRQLESAHADVVQSLIVDAESLVRVLNELMDREGCVVGLDNGVGNLGRGNDGESGHHSVGKLFTDLGDQQSTHTSTGTTTERVGDLEALEAVTTFRLTTDNIKDIVDKLSTFSVVTLGPVVASTRLAKDEVVGTEKLTERTGTDGIHGARFKIDKDGARNILVTGGLLRGVPASVVDLSHG